ncbi:hypothetical protein BC351_08150 [Paenibacillus ferrarius]|uniref:Uncharacterized protein n=1 Tax=Paenibacillus ferrarius TaxID=1469647 RepID=A0A1V4HDD7_9BACL|nr:hypothetical protein BC351_08150 [Paenibacillus ferrarius]
MQLAAFLRMHCCFNRLSLPFWQSRGRFSASQPLSLPFRLAQLSFSAVLLLLPLEPAFLAVSWEVQRFLATEPAISAGSAER